MIRDLTGQKFGRLTAIKPTEQRKHGTVVWECRCECGNIKYATRNNLVQGYTLSCGCLHDEKAAENAKSTAKNLTGKRFGRLIAIEPTEQRCGTYVMWKCICDCGNEVIVASGSLISKKTVSCGCLNKEHAKKSAAINISKFKEKNFVAGTRLDAINNSKPNKNSTTGYRGVTYSKKDRKYIATIMFQGTNHYLGSRDTKEEAAELRRIAESKLYGDFLEWLEEFKRRAKNE